MPIIDSSQFSREIKTLKAHPPILALVGDDETLLQDLLKNYTTSFLSAYGNDFPDFNHEHIHGDKDDVERILEACSTLPFGSEKKLVVFHRLKSGKSLP